MDFNASASVSVNGEMVKNIQCYGASEPNAYSCTGTALHNGLPIAKAIANNVIAWLMTENTLFHSDGFHFQLYRLDRCLRVQRKLPQIVQSPVQPRGASVITLGVCIWHEMGSLLRLTLTKDRYTEVSCWIT